MMLPQIENYWLWFGIASLLGVTGGIYAKGNLFGALSFGICAPVGLAFFAGFAAIGVGAILVAISWMLPEFSKATGEFYLSLPNHLQLILHPAILVTLGLFAMMCHSERMSRGMPSGFSTDYSKSLSPFVKRARR